MADPIAPRPSLQWSHSALAAHLSIISEIRSYSEIDYPLVFAETLLQCADQAETGMEFDGRENSPERNQELEVLVGAYEGLARLFQIGEVAPAGASGLEGNDLDAGLLKDDNEIENEDEFGSGSLNIGSAENAFRAGPEQSEKDKSGASQSSVQYPTTDLNLPTVITTRRLFKYFLKKLVSRLSNAEELHDWIAYMTSKLEQTSVQIRRGVPPTFEVKMDKLGRRIVTPPFANNPLMIPYNARDLFGRAVLTGRRKKARGQRRVGTRTKSVADRKFGKTAKKIGEGAGQEKEDI